MAQSLSSILLHIVFSTKGRNPWLHDDWRPGLHSYVAGIIGKCNGQAVTINSVMDHIHILLVLPRTQTVADLVRSIKTGSCHWIHHQVPGLDGFQWQAGYGAFSVSESNKAAVCEYIRNQAEHHKTVTFQDEYRAFLSRHNIVFDEKYIWD